MAAAAAPVPVPAVWDASTLQALAIRMNPLLTTPITTKLSETDTIGDFQRWSKSVVAEVRTIGLDVLTHLTCGTPFSTVAAVIVDPAAAPADLNSIVPTLPTMGEYIQRVLLAYIKIVTVADGKVQKAIEHCIYGGALSPIAPGFALGVPGAFTVLYNLYFTPGVPKDKQAEMGKLISNSRWPSLPPTAERWSAYENWVMGQVRELELDTPAARVFWWATIYEPPASSPWFALATTARIACSAIQIDHANTNHRDAFLIAMRSEAAIAGRAALKISESGPLSRVAAMRVESNLGVDLGNFDLDADVSAVSRGRPAAPGSRPSSVTRRPCPLCLSTTHPAGYRCSVKTICTVCDSSVHCDGACWIKHGLQSGTFRAMSLPPHVTMQYAAWHEQYKAGTYVKVPGGPGRIKPPTATAASLEAEGDTWQQQEERVASLYGDAPSEAEAANTAAMCAACALTDDDTNMDAQRLENLRPEPQATEVSASRAEIQPYNEFMPYAFTFDTDASTASHVSVAPVVSDLINTVGTQPEILTVAASDAIPSILGAQPPTDILPATAPCNIVPPRAPPAVVSRPIVAALPVAAGPPSTRIATIRRRAPLPPRAPPAVVSRPP